MADTTRPSETPISEQPARRPWSAPQLMEYGHIGKLTQLASGTAGDGMGKRKCL